MIGTLVSVPIAGATMHQVGSHMTGNLAGIGRATNTMIASGVMLHSAKNTGLLKKRRK